MLIFKNTIKKIDQLFMTFIDTVSQYIFKPKSLEKISFIRMDILGDNFIFFPFLLRYKKLFPKALWIVNNRIEKIYSLLNLKYISINSWKFLWNPLHRLKILKDLLNFQFETVVNLVPHRAQVEGDILLKLLRANKKICYGNDFIMYKSFNNSVCSEVIYYNYSNFEKNLPYIHIFKHEKNFFEIFTKQDIENDIRKFYFSAFGELKKLLKNYNIPLPEKNYIVILTDAGALHRIYPKRNWQKILNKLPKNIKIIQLGLKRFQLKHPNLIDLTRKTTLEEAMSIVMNASLVIGNETGLTHLAYLSGVPTICILGGGHFGRFLPWLEFDDIVKCVYKPMDCFQCGWRCKYANLQKGEAPPCISQIPPENVLEAVEYLNKEYKIFK